MRENSLGLLVLVLVLVVAGALFWRSSEAAAPERAPDRAASPATDVAEAPMAPVPADASADHRGTTDVASEGASVIRVVSPLATEEQRFAVDVSVVHDDGPIAPGTAAVAAAFPAADADVSICLRDEPTLTATARTDARGRAHFEFLGADLTTESVVASCGLGGEAEGALSAVATLELTLRVPTRVIVTGRVVDQGGMGVADADLVLHRWPSRADDVGRMWRVGKSGPGGAFRVPMAAGGTFGATHPGYVASPQWQVRVNRGGDPQVLNFELVLVGNPAELAGTVLDATGAPVAGASVEFRSAAPAPSGAELRSAAQSTRSADDGAFTVHGLPPGPIDWAARAAGHGWARGRIELRPGPAPHLDIHLPEPCSVRGVAVGGDGRPVPGANIVAGERGSLCAAETRSAGDGSFELHDLAPGPTPLVATADGTAQGQRAEARGQLDLRPGQPAFWRAELGDAGAPLLRGVVTDTRERPLDGYSIVVRHMLPGHQPSLATSGADGTFAIAIDEPHGLDVRAYAPGRSLTAFADAIRRDVDATEGALLLVVGEGGIGTLRGRIVDESTAGAAAQIDCFHAERREPARFAALADGTFEIDVPAGTLEVKAKHPGHTEVVRHDVHVAPGQILDLGTLQLMRAGGMMGTVRGPDGSSPTTCELMILPTAATNNARISADYMNGGYRFAAIPPGRHTLQISAPGCAAKRFAVDISAGVDLEQPIELQAGIRCRVVVLVPPGAGKTVGLAARVRGGGNVEAWTGSSPVVRTAPGRDGTAEFVTCLPAGSYELVAWTLVGFQASTSVTYAFDDQPEVTLPLKVR